MNTSPPSPQAASSEAVSAALDVAPPVIDPSISPAGETSAPKRGRKAGSKKMGRKKLEPKQQRTHCLSVRLNPPELKEIEKRRGKMPGGEWARRTLLDGPPPAAPAPLNRKAYEDLARAQGNLNQLARALNSHPEAAAEIRAVMEEVRQFRAELIGAKPTKAARSKP